MNSQEALKALAYFRPSLAVFGIDMKNLEDGLGEDLPPEATATFRGILNSLIRHHIPKMLELVEQMDAILTANQDNADDQMEVDDNNDDEEEGFEMLQGGKDTVDVGKEKKQEDPSRQHPITAGNTDTQDLVQEPSTAPNRSRQRSPPARDQNTDSKRLDSEEVPDKNSHSGPRINGRGCTTIPEVVDLVTDDSDEEDSDGQGNLQLHNTSSRAEAAPSGLARQLADADKRTSSSGNAMSNLRMTSRQMKTPWSEKSTNRNYGSDSGYIQSDSDNENEARGDDSDSDYTPAEGDWTQPRRNRKNRNRSQPRLSNTWPETEVDSSGSYCCFFCTYTAKMRFRIRTHMGRKHGDRLEETFGFKISEVWPKCRTCGEHFDSSATLKTHELRHSQEKQFVCQQCGSSFKGERNLTLHVKSSHSEEPQFECVECNTKFTKVNHLRLHRDNQHSKDGWFTCLKCKALFPSKLCLKRHKGQAHSSDKAIPAPETSMN